jgi:hypothetical protein
LKSANSECGSLRTRSFILAFWIQAWWDDRQEARDEKVVLTALLEEFQAKMGLLEMRRTFHTSLLDSSRQLIRASISGEESLTPEEVDRLLADLWWYNPQGEWDSAILGALYEGGNLTVVSDPELRINLARWPSLFRLLEQRVSRDEEYFKNVLMPRPREGRFKSAAILYHFCHNIEKNSCPCHSNTSIRRLTPTFYCFNR